MASAEGRLRCQRIGCDATFTEEDNPEGSCRYHPSPFFHDGMKEWSCCKKRSHDFSLFLQIPGCKTGKHTSEKPVVKVPAATSQRPTPSASMTKQTAETCSRCRQGFFCSDHGSQGKPPVTPTIVDVKTATLPKPAKKKASLNDPQTCQNKGCGKVFKEKDNHDTACEYHPGPPIFHDRVKGWKCCDIHVNEFDEFMAIPPCKKGWHNAGGA